MAGPWPSGDGIGHAHCVSDRDGHDHGHEQRQPVGHAQHNEQCNGQRDSERHAEPDRQQGSGRARAAGQSCGIGVLLNGWMG